jgi:hypothetical protein
MLAGLKTTGTPTTSGKVPASLVSVVGLILVWGLVWANLPSKTELRSAQSSAREAVVPVVPELDLTIPGVSPIGPTGGTRRPAAVPSTGSGGPLASTDASGVPNLSDSRVRQIAEVKCDAEVQQFCPDSLTDEERQRCIAQRLKRLTFACQQIVQRRIVRWKEAEGYKAACAEDARRVCQGVEPGDGRMVSCLQEHAQDLSERCYQSLPKGHLLLRN